MLTDAITTVVVITLMESSHDINECESKALVFFGRGFAYAVEKPNEAFGEDLNRCSMASVEAAKTDRVRQRKSVSTRYTASPMSTYRNYLK